jgi:uncharacterized membrane protein YciS (DUF1049 family)
MRGLAVLGIVIGVAAVAVFLVSGNDQLVPVNLLAIKMEAVPLWRVLLGSFVAGGLVIGLLVTWPYLRLRLRARTQARQISRLEQEVHGLRTLPLPDEESGAQEG